MMQAFEQNERFRNEDDEDEESQEEIDEEERSYKTRCCGLCRGNTPYENVPNRHEKLFRCGRVCAWRSTRSIARIFF